MEARGLAIGYVLLMAAVAGPVGRAAQAPPRPCQQGPLVVPVAKGINFTEQQENDLGDAIAEHFARTYRIVDDDSNAYLQTIGDRILRQLPPTAIRFRFVLVNDPNVNAYAAAGGRVYVTRKMVAFARNEDELAYVVAHEIGHIITRQNAAAYSRLFEAALRMKTFGDRNDVFEKYRRLVEAGPQHVSRSEEKDQQEADRVGLVAAVRAGYAPEAGIELFDRLAETDKKLGNFFTDLIGETRPDSKRLREMVHSLDVVPAECRSGSSTAGASAFEEWRKRVIAASGGSVHGALSAVVLEKPLEPPLRSSITHLQFSRDGRYALAQDDSSIYVLSREPFEFLFRIDADDAQPAQFTPDSLGVVFHTYDLRVERWSLSSRSRTGAFELIARNGCIQTALSPDGRFLVCLEPDFTITLTDVDTSATVFKKKTAYRTDVGEFSFLRYFTLNPLSRDLDTRRHTFDVLQFTFTRDGRQLIVGDAPRAIGIDLQSFTEVNLPGALRDPLRQRFAFVGDDKLVVVDKKHAERSGVLRYPSGELIKTMTIVGGLSAATRGDYVILRPIQDWAVGVLDLASAKIVFATKSVAFDVFGDVQIAERINGEVALYPFASTKPTAIVKLPRAPVGRLMATNASSDLKWVALSGRERGGVWRVDTGERVAHVRGFAGAYLAADGAFYADVPKHAQVVDGKLVDRDRAVVRLDLSSGAARDTASVSAADVFAWQEGRYVLVATPPSDDKAILVLEVRDVETHRMLWKREFANDYPHWFFNGAAGCLTLEWRLSSRPAKDALSRDDGLRAQAEKDKLKGEDMYLELLDLDDGTQRGRILLNADTYGSGTLSVGVSGHVAVSTNVRNQVTVYSLPTGERRGSLFGRYAVASDTGNLLAVQNRDGVLAFVDLKSMSPLTELKLGSPLKLAQFSADGARLLIVTADQIARIIDTQALRH